MDKERDLTREAEKERRLHRFVWPIGWAWAISGLVLGALVAPSGVQPLMQRFDIPSQFVVMGFSISVPVSLEIGVAVVAGLIVQLLGWLFFILELQTEGLYTHGLVSQGIRSVVPLLFVPERAVIVVLPLVLQRHLMT